jgi:hypothetical protein
VGRSRRHRRCDRGRDAAVTRVGRIAAAGQPASSVALNGAQVQAAQGIITSVAKGELPRATGVEMLVQFFNMDAASAETLMGTVGGSFFIAAQEPPGGGA